MANYGIDIAVKVQAQQLEKFNIKLLKTGKLIDNANKSIKNFEKNNLSNVRSINGVNEALNAATINFRKVATGTPQATRAAKEFVEAEKLVNKTLAEQEKLLEKIRRQEQGKEFTRRIRSQGFKKNLEKQSDGSFINKRRQELLLVNRASTLEDRINQTLARRGMILSENGKKIVKNNQARSAGTRGRGGNVGNAISSGLIGGGFPLLFGQGPIAAIGGGIGGLAGGLIGGQAGFALSIAGTTIAGAIDELATALAKPTENIETLVNKFGLVGTSSGDLALELEKLGLKSAAAALLLQEGKVQFGLTTDEIEENTQKMQEFKNSINKLGTGLTLLMSNVLTPLVKELNNLLEGKKPEGISRNITGVIDFFTANLFDLDKRGGILSELPPVRNSNPTKSILTGGERTQFMRFAKDDSLTELFSPESEQKALEEKRLKQLKKRLGILKETAKFNKDILPLQQALDIESKRLTLSSSELRVEQAKNNITNTRNEMLLKAEEFGLRASDELADELLKLEHKLGLQIKILDNAETLLEVEELKNKAALTDLDERIKLEKQRFKLLPKEIKILQQKNKLSSLESSLTIARKTGNEQLVASLNKQIELQKILINQSMILADPIKAEIISLDQQMKQLTEAGVFVVGLSRTIGSSFQDAFKGVINGTMSVTDAFRSMTNRIANHFLDMAARIMATQIQRSILGIFNPLGGIMGGIFGGGGSFGSNSLGINSSGFGSGAMTGNPFRAAGGSVRGGGSYIVGERGPEMFTPGVSGMVTPNNALGGTTNIVVNVDASGSSVEGDESEGRQLGLALSAAIESELVKQKRPGGLLA